jgi:hypothetical protein
MFANGTRRSRLKTTVDCLPARLSATESFTPVVVMNSWPAASICLERGPLCELR